METIDKSYRGERLPSGVRPLIFISTEAHNYDDGGNKFEGFKTRILIFAVGAEMVARQLTIDTTNNPGVLGELFKVEDAFRAGLELARTLVEATYYSSGAFPARWSDRGDGRYPVEECNFGREYVLMADEEKAQFTLDRPGTKLLKAPFFNQLLKAREVMVEVESNTARFLGVAGR